MVLDFVDSSWIDIYPRYGVLDCRNTSTDSIISQL